MIYWHSLAGRLFKAVFGAYLILAILVTLIQLVIEYSAIQRLIRSDLASLTQSFNGGITGAMWELDRPLMTTMVQGIAQSSIVTGVKIQSSDGEFSVSFGKVPTVTSHDANTIFSPYQYNTTRLVKQTPVKARELGVLTIFSDRSVALNRVKHSFIVILINSIIKTTGLWIIFYLVITWGLSRPLSRMAEMISQIKFASESNKMMLLEHPHHDELGTLAESMNKMQERLFSAHNELEWSNQELRQNQAYLVEAEALAKLGHFSWDLKTNELVCSDEMNRLFGFQPGQSVTTQAMFLQSIHPDDHDMVLDKLKLLYDQHDYTEYLFRILWPDGTLLHIQGRNSVVHDENGIPIRIHGTVQDITQQIITRQKLLEYQATLIQLTEKLDKTSKQERKTIAAELHDDLAQTLALCSLRLSAPNLACSAEQAREISFIKARIDIAIDTIRAMILRISQPVLDQIGLSSALENLVETMQNDWGVRVTFRGNLLPDTVPASLVAAVFQIIKELLTNVAKHAEAPEAWLTLRLENTDIVIQVDDEGKGFDADIARSGFGLFNIRHKVQSLNGTCSISSGPDSGTHTTILIPLPAAHT